MDNKKQILFFMMGRSGSGKDSIISRYFEDPDRLVKTKIVPITTREMRDGERDGVEYEFISDDGFQRIIKSGRLLDYKVYPKFNNLGKQVNTYYGYPKPYDTYSIITGPWDAYTSIREKYLDTGTFRLVPIYITTNEEYELLYRAICRESKNPVPNYKEVARRFCADQHDYPTTEEIKKIIGEQYVVINTNIALSLVSIGDIILNTFKEENLL